MGDLQATIEIAVELSSFHNVDLFQRGFYHIRCMLKPPEKTPSSVDVEYRRNSGDPNATEDCLFPALVTPSGMTAVSRTFQILYRNEEVNINDAFIFRLYMLIDSNRITEQIDSADVQLVMELFFSDSEVGPKSPESLASVSTQILKLHLSPIKGVHHHVPVLFDYFHFAVVDTTIHAALTGLSLPDPSIIKPVKTSWFGLKSSTSPRISTPAFYTKLFGTKPLNDIQNSRTPAEQRQIRFAYDTHRSLCSMLLSAEVNLLAYFECLAEYLPSNERLDIGKVDFGERVDSLINGIEAAKTANEVFAQICSDLNSISLEMSLVWSQFLESYTLNKRILPYFREEHHRQRIGHFSEAFFIQEFTLNELQIQQDQSFQLHQSLSQRVKSSRYYQSIPALVVECPMLDGDSISNPIIFEDKYCASSEHDTAFCDEFLDIIDNCRTDSEDRYHGDSNHGDGIRGDGNEAAGGSDDFFNDEELLIIENDYDSPNSYINEGLVLRDPSSLNTAAQGRPPIRETMILSDSSEDEFSDGGYYRTSNDRSTAPDDVRVTFDLGEKYNMQEDSRTANSTEVKSTENEELVKDGISNDVCTDESDIPVSKSRNCVVSNIADKMVENQDNQDSCENDVTTETKLSFDKTDNSNDMGDGDGEGEAGEEGKETAAVMASPSEVAEVNASSEESNVIDNNVIQPLSPCNMELENVSVSESESKAGKDNDDKSEEISLEEITFEESNYQENDEKGEDSGSETFVIASEDMEDDKSKSEKISGKEKPNLEEKTANIDIEREEAPVVQSDSRENTEKMEDESAKTPDEQEMIENEAAVERADDMQIKTTEIEPSELQTESERFVTENIMEDSVRQDTSIEKDEIGKCDIQSGDQESNQNNVTPDDVTEDKESVTSEGNKTASILPLWEKSLLSYDEQRVHHKIEPVRTIPSDVSKINASSLLSVTNNVTQGVIDQQPGASRSRDSVTTDSPSDSSAYETPMSSETNTSESQADSSSTSEGAGMKKGSSEEKTDGKKKKRAQMKTLSTLGSCLPVNCAGNTSPSFKLTRGGSVYGGSVKSRFELAKRFVKRQLHYSCRIYSDLHLERIREPYFTGERADNMETHLVVCVHGLDGNSGDLRLFRCYLEMALPSTRFDFLMSEVNQPDTFVTFEEMTEKLVQEIRHFIDAYSIFPSKVSFIGHSLGNIIIRSALTHPSMAPLIDKLHTLLSLSGPHLGMLYPTSPLVSTGLWLMQKWKKSDALLQLSLHDHQDLRQCFLYKLSQSKGLEHFKNLLLVSSVQDHYVPFHSARMEMCRTAARDTSEFGTVYREMVSNLLAPLQNKSSTTFIRYSVHHGLQSSANSFIGRAAHIAMLDSELFIEKLLLVSALDYFR